MEKEYKSRNRVFSQQTNTKLSLVGEVTPLSFRCVQTLIQSVGVHPGECFFLFYSILFFIFYLG